MTTARLSWKLTLSYTLVTAAALAVVELVALGIFLTAVSNPQFLPGLAARAVWASAPQVYPFLRGEEPDIDGLQSWLSRVGHSGFTVEDRAGLTVSFSAGQPGDAGEFLAVADLQGRILAVEPRAAEAAAASAIKSAALRPLITAVLAGAGDAERSYALMPQRRLVVAAPISGPDGRVAGLLVVGTRLPSATSILRDLLAVFGASLVLFVVGAGVLGTVFGFFTARGLVRRLNRIVRASEAWRQGRFQVMVQDDSRDELGQVARSLNDMARQLQGLMQARRELGILEERHRLARELHDSVKQQVFAIAMELGAARACLPRHPEAAQGHLERAAELARRVQAELAGLIQELRPLCVQEQGLARAFRSLAGEWSRQTGVVGETHVEEVGELPSAVAEALFRVAQEALANVARHSGARTVRLSLAREGSGVMLQVIDDGRGFHVEAAQTAGMGLRNMRERMEGVGGSLHIESAPGRGTRLVAVWPDRGARGEV